MSTQSKLVERLAAKTEVNELDWKPTGSENTFTVSFKLRLIVLSRIPVANSATYRVDKIIDANGNIVETFSDGELDTAQFSNT